MASYNTWKQEGTIDILEPSLISLDKDLLNVPMLEEGVGKYIQAMKSNIFFPMTIKVFEKHYSIFFKKIRVC